MPSDSDNTADRRRQRAGFSIFVDRVEADGGQSVWETRLYHAETGLETVQENVSPSAWIDWLVERLLDLEDELPVPTNGEATTIEVADVKLLQPTIEQYSDAERDSRSLRAELIVELKGTNRIEQEIGRQVLHQLTAEPPPQRKDRYDERQ